MPWYDQDKAYSFLNKHGIAVRAIGGPPIPRLLSYTLHQ